MNPSDFAVVGIGASAGGIEAFHHFFQPMPADCGMAFVVILHLPADRKSMLTEILARWTAMPVVELAPGTQLRANHVYVSPPHTVVGIADGVFEVRRPLEQERRFRPIDSFFDALGSAFSERAIGIILSGTGSDGALGIKSIKECGGLTLAQGSNGLAPQYGEMPAGAIATGAVDLIVPVEEMAGQLLRLQRFREALPEREARGSDINALRLQICDLLRTRLGHDFSGYRSQTFLRRVARRMQVQNVTTLEDYIARLSNDAAEPALLFRDLLIRVTSFFRDKEAFDTLAQAVIPRLFAGKGADEVVRLWVPGCATGEEAYSLAILLREHMDTLAVLPRVQLFATDIDELAISTARLGRYPKTLVQGLPEERLRRFFAVSDTGYAVAKEIRDLCTFSVQNVIRDPPFCLMNLVSCRNLLIYMNPELQSRIIPIFHYALLPGGILLLGGSESVAPHAHLFDTLDKPARIFQRREGRSPPLQLSWPRPLVISSGQSSAGGPMNDPSSRTHRSQAEPVVSSLSTPPPAARFKDLLAEPSSDELVGRLKLALSATCEELQALSEEHQTALEELRSSNEELHSVNEEMQSTNEELETSKEELQSLNEELHTVNLRLTEKIDELDKTNSDLRNLFDSTEIATVFLDRHLLIRSFTPAIATLYNLIPSDQGRPITDIASSLLYPSLREDVAFVLSSLEPLERRVVRADRQTHYMLRILPYREPDNSVNGVLVTFVDVTNIVKAEEALVAADMRKDVFLATLSHELRNPLAPVRMAAQLLQSPKLQPSELVHAQSVIVRQVAHMSSLLDDLLDVSRITRGTFFIKKETVELGLLIDEAVETAEGLIQGKQHTLRVEKPPSALYLDVDPVRITQVITNLLTNAAKYTPPSGLITLGVRSEARHLVVFVRDNGVGLEADSLDSVFDMFTRVDSEIGRTEGGLGVGLALAKGLMELHGGDLRAASAGRGRGSEFMIFIPRSLIAELASSPATHADGEAPPIVPRRILVADDNKDSADTMSMLLELAGHEVHVAHSGTQALEIAQRIKPEVGILDIGMPDVSGYEVADRIRREPWGDAMILIAVTGWGQDADKRLAIAAGFDHHLTKPVDPHRLDQLLQY